MWSIDVPVEGPASRRPWTNGMAFVLPINSIIPLRAQLASGQDMCQSIMLFCCVSGKTDWLSYTLSVSRRRKVKWLPRNRVLHRESTLARGCLQLWEKSIRRKRRLISTGQRKEWAEDRMRLRLTWTHYSVLGRQSTWLDFKAVLLYGSTRYYIWPLDSGDGSLVLLYSIGPERTYWCWWSDVCLCWTVQLYTNRLGTGFKPYRSTAVIFIKSDVLWYLSCSIISQADPLGI